MIHWHCDACREKGELPLDLSSRFYDIQISAWAQHTMLSPTCSSRDTRMRYSDKPIAPLALSPATPAQRAGWPNAGWWVFDSNGQVYSGEDEESARRNYEKAKDELLAHTVPGSVVVLRDRKIAAVFMRTLKDTEMSRDNKAPAG